MRALENWNWPGNVRELENFIERSVILSSGTSLRAPLAEIRPNVADGTGGATLEQVERDHIMRVLRESDGVVTTAATRLGLHRTTLNAMMRKLASPAKISEHAPEYLEAGLSPARGLSAARPRGPTSQRRSRNPDACAATGSTLSDPRL